MAIPTHQLTIRIAKNILQGHFRWDVLSKIFIQYPVKTSFQPVKNLIQRELCHPKYARNFSGLSRNRPLVPVSRKSRNFSGVLRLTSFSLYLQNKGVSRHETLQLFKFLFPLQQMKRSASQNKRVGV